MSHFLDRETVAKAHSTMWLMLHSPMPWPLSDRAIALCQKWLTNNFFNERCLPRIFIPWLSLRGESWALQAVAHLFWRARV